MILDTNPLLRTGTFTVIHHHHAPEYHQCCQHLLPGQAVHTDADADDYGNDGLHIRVHTDQCRTDALLPQRNEEISDECGAYDEESQLRQIRPREAACVQFPEFDASPRQGHYRGEKEYFGFYVDGIANPEEQPFAPFDNKPFYS